MSVKEERTFALFVSSSFDSAVNPLRELYLVDIDSQMNICSGLSGISVLQTHHVFLAGSSATPKRFPPRTSNQQALD
jgi:hypothetical protein